MVLEITPIKRFAYYARKIATRVDFLVYRNVLNNLKQSRNKKRSRKEHSHMNK